MRNNNNSKKAIFIFFIIILVLQMPASLIVNGSIKIDLISISRIIQLSSAVSFLFLVTRGSKRDWLSIFIGGSILIQLFVTITYEPKNELIAYNFIPVLLLIAAVSFSGTFRDWLKSIFIFGCISTILPIYFKDPSFILSLSSFSGNYLFAFFSITTSTLIVYILSTQKEFSEKMQEELNIQAVRLKDEFNQIEKLRMQLEIGETVLKVAHDIRSPLSILESALLVNVQQSNDIEIAKEAIRKLKGIANELLGKGRDREAIFNSHYEVSNIINGTIRSKQFEFPQRKFLLDISLKKEIVLCNDIILDSIFSNILNNAIEASSDEEEIFVSAHLNGAWVEILFIDKGCGIDKKTLEKLGSEKISNKDSGNGIGIFSAKKELIKIGASLEITSELNIGTKIQIKIPVVQQKPNQTIVLLDDDDLVRLTWESKAKKSGINFLAFSNPKDLEDALSGFHQETIFYIDSELGIFSGEKIAEELHSKGFQNLSIASGHPASKFSGYPFLKSVISKTPPF